MKQLIATTIRAFSLLDSGLRRRWMALIPLAIVTAGLESLGALLIFALLRLVVDPGAFGTMPGAAQFQSIFSGSGEAKQLVVFAILVAVFYVIKNGIRFCEAYFRQTCAATASATFSGVHST